MKFSEMQTFVLGEIVRGNQEGFDETRRLFNPNGEILILIDSGGGDCNSGFTLADMIRSHGHVTGLTLGLCDSMAIPVLQACRTRLATPKASFFFHSLETKVTVRNLEVYNDEWVEDRIGELKKEQERYFQYVLGRTNKHVNRDTIFDWCKKETRIFAEEALKCGLVDQIIDWEVDPATFNLTSIPAD
jgi:ATP-dependent protease ClpP protease subunit